MQPEAAVKAAELAVSLRFSPIPLYGKRPMLPGWQKMEKEKAMSVIKSMAEKKQKFNIGVVCGPKSEIVVVDVDNKDGEEDCGLVFWNELTKVHGVPDTLTVKTGGGGYHYYFVFDDRMLKLGNRTGLCGYRIDLKNVGGQVVFPGSIHPDTKKEYKIVGGKTTDGITTIALMPDWLYELFYDNPNGKK